MVRSIAVFMCIIAADALLKVPFSLSININNRRFGLKVSPSEENESLNRPPIVPFDFVRDEFARADVPLPTPPEAGRQKQVDKSLQSTPVVVKNARVKSPEEIELDRSRPTGYDNVDEEDEDMGVLPPFDLSSEEDNAFTKFLKNTYFDSPYDTRKRKQAKYVIRNITLISFAIGFIFTAVWYAFPGKFISIRRDTDFTQRYQTTYIDPAELLTEEFQMNGGVYFDDAVGLPPKEETRFAPPPAKTFLPPQEGIKEEF